MFKLITDGTDIEGSKPMSEMQPGEIAKIVSVLYKGHIVMRTLSTYTFEVMDLSDSAPGMCWDEGNNHKVIPLKKGAHIALEVI